MQCCSYWFQFDCILHNNDSNNNNDNRSSSNNNRKLFHFSSGNINRRWTIERVTLYYRWFFFLCYSKRFHSDESVFVGAFTVCMCVCFSPYFVAVNALENGAIMLWHIVLKWKIFCLSVFFV